MILSPSQYQMVWEYWHPERTLKPEDFKSTCSRKWFLDKVLKVPQPPFAATTLGTILHAIVERYLLADDNGRDVLTGEPVDLYPEGWDKELKYQSDKDLIKALITHAIEEGHLKRRKGRKVEEAMSDGIKHWSGFGEQVWKIVRGASKGSSDDIFLTGFLDHRYGNVIEDWKTSSDPTKWGLNTDPKSTKYLGYDIKMLMYAAWLHAFDPQESYVLRHVYFDKKSTPEEPRVIPVEVTVSVEHVENFTKWMMEAAEYIYELKSSNSRATLTKMHKGELACGKYGGCAYQKICNRQLTIEQHTKLLTQQKEDTNMSALAKLRANKAGKKDAPKEETKTEPQDVQDMASEEKTKSVGKTQETGKTPKTTEKKETKTESKPEAKKAAAKSTGASADSGASSKRSAESSPVDATKVDFALFINCRPSVGFKPSKSIQELLFAIKQQANLTCGIWDRCSFYEENIDMILKELEGKNIIASNYSTEAGHLLDLLIARAKVVVEG